MHFRDLFDREGTTFSFEFFPPKTSASASSLFRTISDLEPLKPSYVSVTYGAGGGSRGLTMDLVRKLHEETSLTVVPHMTCVWHTEAEIHDMLERYASTGIENVLALGGDPPRNMPGYDRSRDAFRYASDLVSYVRRFPATFAGSSLRDDRGFGVAVAGYPEGHPSTPNRLLEMDHLKAKVDAGADCVVTQLFFDNREFYDFRARCELAGIGVPIIAGVMPITSGTGLRRMADLAAGTRFPASLLRSLGRADGDDAAVRRVGEHWATEQCRDLLDHGVAGIHFYTLNRSSATRRIYENLGVRDSRQLAEPPAGLAATG